MKLNKIKWVVLLSFLYWSHSVFAIPRPDTFAVAELQAILEAHQEKTVFYGVFKSMELIDKNIENKKYQVKTQTPSGELCVQVTLKSQMAQPKGNARSSDEVVVDVLEVSEPEICK